MYAIVSSSVACALSVQLGLCVSLQSYGLELGVIQPNGLDGEAVPDLATWKLSPEKDAWRIVSRSPDGDAFLALVVSEGLVLS